MGTEIAAAAVEVNNVSFTYLGRGGPSLANVDLNIPAGDFLLITGATGCGKSTLLKTFNGLIPHESGGLLTGDVRVEGRNIRDLSVAELSRTVGMMFQSPDDQIFSTTAADETAFILENMGVDFKEIPGRVSEALAWVGLEGMETTSVHALSGGQKQRLALAAVLVAQPRILALDEPISQLDPQGGAELLRVVYRLNRTRGITVVMVEHRLHEVLPLCRHVAVMDSGKIVWQGTRQQAFLQPEVFVRRGLRLPQTVDVCRRLGVDVSTASVPGTVAAVRQSYTVPACRAAAATTPAIDGSGSGREQPVIEINGLVFQYEKKGPKILDDISLTIGKGQFVALMGNNGAGKSTLLNHIGGLLRPVAGQVRVMGKDARQAGCQVGLVLQNPDFMLFNTTVTAEVAFALRRQNKPGGWAHCRRLIARLGLNGLEDDFPLALSRGQRLRVAIAAVLSYQPAVLLLDEPTTGQDIGHIEEVVGLLKEYVTGGGTVIFCTHDTEVAARHAGRVVVMTGGRVVADAPPAQIFSRKDLLCSAGLKPPAVLEFARQLYGGTALTVEEVVSYVRQDALGSNAVGYLYF